MNIKSIRSFAYGYLESYTTNVRTEKNLNDFLNTKCDNPYSEWKVCALLFTDKFDTPPLIIALSRDYNKKIAIGEIRAKNEKISKMYGIEKYPSLIMLYQGEKIGEFEGEIHYDDLKRFFNLYHGDATLRRISQIKKASFVPKLTEYDYNLLCKGEKSTICFIFIFEKESKVNKELIEKIKASFPSLPGTFLYTTKDKYSKLLNVCDEESSSNINVPTLLAVKNRKNQIRGNYLEGEFGESNISNFVDRVYGGDLQLKKCKAIDELLK